MYKNLEKCKNKYNRQTIDQLVHTILTIDKVHTTPQSAQNCRPGLGGLNQVYGPNRPTVNWLEAESNCTIQIKIALKQNNNNQDNYM